MGEGGEGVEGGMLRGVGVVRGAGGRVRVGVGVGVEHFGGCKGLLGRWNGEGVESGVVY